MLLLALVTWLLIGIAKGKMRNMVQIMLQEFAKVAIELSSTYDILIFGGPNEINIASDIENFLIGDANRRKR